MVLQDEMRRVLDAARVLLDEHEALAKGNKVLVGSSMERVKKAEEDVVTLRSALIRELTQVGTLLVNREDVLRGAFAVEDIFGHINGIAFKMSQMPRSTAKNKKYKDAVATMLGLLLDGISKLNEAVRALSVNPDQSIQMAAQVGQIESSMDTAYREASAMTMKTATGFKELIIMKDVFSSLEDAADAMLNASDAATILALGI